MFGYIHGITHTILRYLPRGRRDAATRRYRLPLVRFEPEDAIPFAPVFAAFDAVGLDFPLVEAGDDSSKTDANLFIGVAVDFFDVLAVSFVAGNERLEVVLDLLAVDVSSFGIAGEGFPSALLARVSFLEAESSTAESDAPPPWPISGVLASLELLDDDVVSAMAWPFRGTSSVLLVLDNTFASSAMSSDDDFASVRPSKDDDLAFALAVDEEALVSSALLPPDDDFASV